VNSATVDSPHLLRASVTFARALSLGDLEGATACFARDGCLITPDSTAVHGRDRVRPILAQLVARGIEVRVELSHAVSAGEVVLVNERWKVSSGPAEGLRVEQTLNPTLVLRQLEGEWKLAIAAPWGRGQAYPA
jgi:uncharacterized protein (TIGR02246 family)